MRIPSKLFSVVGLLVVAALAASVADARSLSAKRLRGAHASVSDPRWGIPYDPDGPAYPTRHGGLTASPDFQLQR